MANEKGVSTVRVSPVNTTSAALSSTTAMPSVANRIVRSSPRATRSMTPA